MAWSVCNIILLTTKYNTSRYNAVVCKSYLFINSNDLSDKTYEKYDKVDRKILFMSVTFNINVII